MESFDLVMALFAFIVLWMVIELNGGGGGGTRDRVQVPVPVR